MQVTYDEASDVEESPALLQPARRDEKTLNRVIHAAVKYVTNHLISRVPSFTVRHAWYRQVLGWQIGPRAAILMGQQIDFGKLRGRGKPVIIGAGAVINRGCFLQTFGGLIIGENSSISTGVSIVTGTHDINAPDFAEVRKPIVIGHHVWIGTNAVILGGATIEEGAVICAGSVVRSYVRANAVVDGVPGKVVGRRLLENPSYSFDYHPLFE